MTRKAPSLAGRALLALVLMFGFYALALGLCATLGWLCWLDWHKGRNFHPKLWLFAAITVGVVLWSVFPRRVRMDDPGVPLTRQQAPRLWRMIEEIAGKAGQPLPKQVFLVPEINAFVAQRNSWLGFGGERILGIGLPLLQVLTVPETKAVLAHEFGHFHGGDTRLGPFLYKVHAAMARTIVNLKQADSPVHKPFEWYGLLFLRLTNAISRAQEFAADALSVRLVGLAPAQSALQRVGQVGPLFDAYLEREYFPVLNRGLRPPMIAGFATFLGSTRIRQAQVEIGEEAMQARGNPYDTHPPLPQRLAAAAEVDEAGPERSEGPIGTTLLDGLPALEDAVLRFLTGKGDVLKVPKGDWADTGPLFAGQWRDLAKDLAPGLEASTTAELPRWTKELETFAKKVAKDVPTEQRRNFGTWCLGALLGAALVQNGWRAVTGPGEPVLVERDGEQLDPLQLANDAVSGKLATPAWQELCERHGIAALPLTGPAAAPKA